MDELLIIFIKNPVIGKVKTRLAKDVGDSEALSIYHKLLSKTKAETKLLACDKWLFYSDHIEEKDIWDDHFDKRVQQGNNLGNRMYNAFDQGFNSGYKKVAIIGSDCWEIDEHTIKDAFDRLNDNRFVVGPANDGGYYLLGMNQWSPDVFDNISWSTEDVLQQTLKSFGSSSYFLLKEMIDIDTIDDLKQFPEIYNATF